MQTKLITQVSVMRAIPMQTRQVLLALLLGLALLTLPAAQVQARGAPESFADLAEKFSPAVVNITTSSLVAANTEGGPLEIGRAHV